MKVFLIHLKFSICHKNYEVYSMLFSKAKTLEKHINLLNNISNKLQICLVFMVQRVFNYPVEIQT